ncbi:carboxylesterase [Penicillium argentinense]|uniref:Carboxylesterase n=1 Tax=Penicillium argentinense TaxID=1131581 RepID=A0A9W9EYM6_9EURO|nr:carboxylesterase [Penicillium argentinense]KAJ5090261.1 carboxylesterase [Penicillium argentinense]
MVYIYGGRDTIGQIYDSAYDPAALITGASQKGYPIIYVAMNYRFGIFGFAATAALNQSNSLNAGLQDQRLALEWVQRNIEAFVITAFEGTKKAPFQRAIMQSGNAAADAGTARNLTAVRTAELIKMFIPDSPSRLLSSGRFGRNIDVITGWTQNDQSFFTPSTIKTESDIADYLSASLPNLSKKNIQNALSLYPASSFSGIPSENVSAQFFRASQVCRDCQFTCTSLHFVQMNNKYSDSTTSNYIYVLHQTIFSPLFAEQVTSYLGDSHFSDIPYVFNETTTRYSFLASPSDIGLSSQMSGSWASFAASGIIGGPDDGIATIDDKNDSFERLGERCAFWSSPDILEQIGV